MQKSKQDFSRKFTCQNIKIHYNNFHLKILYMARSKPVQEPVPKIPPTPEELALWHEIGVSLAGQEQRRQARGAREAERTARA